MSLLQESQRTTTLLCASLFLMFLVYTIKPLNLTEPRAEVSSHHSNSSQLRAQSPSPSPTIAHQRSVLHQLRSLYEIIMHTGALSMTGAPSLTPEQRCNNLTTP